MEENTELESSEQLCAEVSELCQGSALPKELLAVPAALLRGMLYARPPQITEQGPLKFVPGAVMHRDYHPATFMEEGAHPWGALFVQHPEGWAVYHPNNCASRGVHRGFDAPVPNLLPLNRAPRMIDGEAVAERYDLDQGNGIHIFNNWVGLPSCPTDHSDELPTDETSDALPADVDSSSVCRSASL